MTGMMPVWSFSRTWISGLARRAAWLGAGTTCHQSAWPDRNARIDASGSAMGCQITRSNQARLPPLVKLGASRRG